MLISCVVYFALGDNTNKNTLVCPLYWFTTTENRVVLVHTLLIIIVKNSQFLSRCQSEIIILHHIYVGNKVWSENGYFASNFAEWAVADIFFNNIVFLYHTK